MVRILLARDAVSTYPTQSLSHIEGTGRIEQICYHLVPARWTHLRKNPKNQLSRVRAQAIKSTFCTPPRPLCLTIRGEGLVVGSAPKPARRVTHWERARDLVQALLGDGPVPAPDVEAAAKAAGVSARTLRQMKKAPRVSARRRKSREDGRDVFHWFWELRAAEANDGDDGV